MTMEYLKELAKDDPRAMKRLAQKLWNTVGKRKSQGGESQRTIRTRGTRVPLKTPYRRIIVRNGRKYHPTKGYRGHVDA